MLRILLRNVMITLFLVSISNSSFALLNIELTKWVNNAIPIGIVPLAGQTNDLNAPNNIANIVANDLKNSGRFKVTPPQNMSQTPSSPTAINYRYWRDQGLNYLAVGEVHARGGNQYQVRISLVNLYASTEKQNANQVLFEQTFDVPAHELRSLGHHVSDIIYQKLLGIRGIFSTRIAYVAVERSANNNARYVLEIADVDGYGPKPLLSSSQPIMSPAWSPHGTQIAYVTFENNVSQIYIQDVATGHRKVVSSFKGINGAPAWSPDGNRLALVLSKSGAAKIYTLELNTGKLQQITQGFSIDTEPDWSPDGRSIIFTSDRGGNPQIYRVNLASGQTERVTFNGTYNARARFTPDGKAIVMLHRDEQRNFDIAQQDLQSGSLMLLTRSGLDESPSIAPNNTMVLYASNLGNNLQLGIVSTDGRVKLRLPSRRGDVQEPAWSPFLS